ncbi:unnamed protein product [Schistocephalus solidus]|uniref:C2H2-type domain-containing protein n=1 Tax=Schistocephalus solidus TaxID=70667 RepID=A0A183TNM4_SCHSO|nr:unnamed protein product [Schistocephalus solidus]
MCPKKMLGLTSSAAGRGSQIANYAIVKLKQTTIPPVLIPLAILSRLLGSNRPERRTALVARELARYKVDIAALSETRFSEQGQLEEVGANYTLFWSGRPKAEQRDAVATSDYLPTATSNTTTAPSTRDGDSVLTCPHCDRTFNSHICLLGHFRIHRKETGKLVPGAPTHSRDHRLQCPHCPRAFTHHMNLLSQMRIHESGIHRDDSPFCAPIKISHIPLMSSNTSTSSRAPTDSAPADLTCSHFHCACASRIGFVDHLRIHRIETGEPVPGAPTYTHRTRLNCPHCPRAFTHRMGLLGHMRHHEICDRTPPAIPQHYISPHQPLHLM